MPLDGDFAPRHHGISARVDWITQPDAAAAASLDNAARRHRRNGLLQFVRVASHPQEQRVRVVVDRPKIIAEKCPAAVYDHCVGSLVRTPPQYDVFIATLFLKIIFSEHK